MCTVVLLLACININMNVNQNSSWYKIINQVLMLLETRAADQHTSTAKNRK